MLNTIPNEKEMTALVGKSLYDVWNRLCALIDEKYDMDCLWDKGGKAWKYEYKYRRGGKTLCALYARENCVGFMIILGKNERLKFETDRENYSTEVQEIYDETQTYHDGKWIMFEPVDTSLFNDFIRLLGIKRKPNRKLSYYHRIIQLLVSWTDLLYLIGIKPYMRTPCLPLENYTSNFQNAAAWINLSSGISLSPFLFTQWGIFICRGFLHNIFQRLALLLCQFFIPNL